MATEYDLLNVFTNVGMTLQISAQHHIEVQGILKKNSDFSRNHIRRSKVA
jgi:hypothetical protein